MDHIVTLDSRQEAALQAAAESFVRQHRGDTMKALKEQMLLRIEISAPNHGRQVLTLGGHAFRRFH